MNLHTARHVFQARWILLFGWVLVMFIYLDWLFYPVSADSRMRFPSPSLLHPSHEIDMALRAVIGLDWLDSSGRGIEPILDPTNPFMSAANPRAYLSATAILLLIGVLAVWKFVVPDRSEVSFLPARRRPTWWAVAAAAFMAALLTLALEVVLFHRAGLWADLVVKGPSSVISAHLWQKAVPLFMLDLGIWYVVLGRTWQRGQRYWQLESMTRWLLLASVAVWVALTIFGASSPDWDLGLGSLYVSKAIAVSVILWAWTSRLILLFQLRKFERQSDENICFACGYDLRASPGACPECGASRLPESKG